MSIASGYDNAPTSTDELLRTTAQAHLGAEAASRVLAELQQRDLRDRAVFLVRAAEFLDMFREQAATLPDSPDSLPQEDHRHVVVPIHTAHEAVSEPVTTEEASPVEEPHRELPGEHAQVITEEAVMEDLELEDQFQLDSRIQGLLEKICDKASLTTLDLSTTDRDAVARALLEMRGRLDARIKPEVVVKMLQLTYDGAKFGDIATELSIPSAAAVSQRWYKLRDGIIANVEELGVDPVAVLNAHRRNRTDDEIDIRDTKVVEPEGMSVEDHGDMVVLDVDQPKTVPEQYSPEEAHVEVDFDEVLAKFCESDETLRASIQDLLTEDKYDADTMSRGREILADLVGLYARDSLAARASLRTDSRGVYEVLKDLTGINARSNSLPRTLNIILKYNQGVAEEQLDSALSNLLEYAITQNYSIQPTVTRRSTTAAPSMMPLKRPEQKPVTPVQYASEVDLFAIANGEAQVGGDEWDIAAEAFFDELSHGKKLTRTQAEMLKARVLGNDMSKDISDDMKGLLTLLQVKSKEPGVRIDANPKVRRVFDQFTMYSLGPQTIDDIAQREERALRAKNISKKVSARTIRRQLVGGIAAVMEER